MLQACLNGAREPGSHPSVPITPQQLAADAAGCAELGVTSFHLHPRDAVGLEVLAGPEVATSVSVVRAAVARAEIGVTTGAWIVPDPVRRSELVRGWAGLAAGRPDFASVNVHEDGWLAVADALRDAGIGIELGVFHLGAARTLLDAGVPSGTVRVLAEVRPGETVRTRRGWSTCSCRSACRSCCTVRTTARGRCSTTRWRAGWTPASASKTRSPRVTGRWRSTTRNSSASRAEITEKHW